METINIAKHFVDLQLSAVKELGAIVILVPNLRVEYTTPESATKLSKIGTVTETAIILTWPNAELADEKKSGGYNNAVNWAKQNGLVQSGSEVPTAVLKRLSVMDLIAKGVNSDGSIHLWSTTNDELPPINYADYDPLDDYDPAGQDYGTSNAFVFCM